MTPDQLGVSRETFDALETYVSLLRRWSNHISLVSKRDRLHVWSRHIADAIGLVDVLPRAGLIVDVGSGNGIPGIVIAVLARTQNWDVHVLLVESDHRKAAFLTEVVRILELPASVSITKFPDTEVSEPYSLVMRGLSSVGEVSSWSQQRLGFLQCAYLLKSGNVENELRDLALSRSEAVRIHMNRLLESSWILMLSPSGSA